MAIGSDSLATNLALLEIVLVFLLALLAPFCTRFGAERPLSRMHVTLGRLASHRGWCIVLVGLITFGAKAALAPVLGIRAPMVHDEFSYLLAGDTFASGRLANPIHPMWVHFETFHVDFHPTYMSMYPPLQGAFLALGKVLFGHPVAGVWISAAAFCAALCWMLQGWVSPGWALLGACVAVLRLALFSAWGNTYFGGAPAALGGALVLGALPRLKATPQPSNAMILTGGLLLLANSRPYEGFVLAIPIALSLIFWATSESQPPFSVILKRAFFPAAAVLLVGAGFMAYYNWQVFGNALTLPYVLNRQTYAVVGVFLWDKPRAVPAYNHPAFHDFFVGFELLRFQYATTWQGFLDMNIRKIIGGWAFFIGPALTLPLVTAATIVRKEEMRFPVAVGAAFSAGLLLITWFTPHYAAPATALLYLVIIYGLRHMRQWRIQNRRVGLVFATGILAVCVLMAAARVTAGPAPPGDDAFLSWCCSGNGNQERAAVLRQLSDLPGRHLVLVRYEKEFSHNEWVYNEPNIDQAKVVWARFMDPPKNRELLDYFQNHHIWLLDTGETPSRLSRYGRSTE